MQVLGVPLTAELVYSGLRVAQALTYVVTKFNFDHQFQQIKSTQEEQYQKGPFRKTFKFNGKEGTSYRFLEILQDEVCVVERWCQSLSKFPTGVLTVITWTIQGQAIRHEFIVVQTRKYIGTIEISKDNSEPIVLIQFWEAPTEASKQRIHDEQIIGKSDDLFDKRPWNRSLKKFDQSEIGQLRFQQINNLINITIESWRQIGDTNLILPKDYDVFQKNCKSLARSILYFSAKEMDPQTVLKSMLGTFTDKPMKIPHIDIIAIEAAVWEGQRLSDDRAKAMDGAFKLLKQVRFK